ncbi:HTH_48 domain-containing protein [Trichonephila clavipes]|uniref:HTH_48 domain-containing protein n=1 Tax=Trichonephila clavipes TaxID=2585209 RepID=A0A8X6WEM9_TRICX|nr:HTH_48 domain-containing protein [Trichonephila clavipes]
MEIFISEVGSINKENTQSYLEFISGTVGISSKSFLRKRIFHSSDFEMSSLEQRANIEFCVLLEKSPSEILEMLK